MKPNTKYLEWSEWKGYDCTRGRMVYDETTGVVKIEVYPPPTIYEFNATIQGPRSGPAGMEG